jgi:hypothetical protein
MSVAYSNFASHFIIARELAYVVSNDYDGVGQRRSKCTSDSVVCTRGPPTPVYTSKQSLSSSPATICSRNTTS